MTIVCEGPCDNCGIETRTKDSSKHLCIDCDKSLQSVKAEDDLKNSDLFRECRRCHESLNVTAFDVTNRIKETDQFRQYLWECRECLQKKSINCKTCKIEKSEEQFEEFEFSDTGKFRAKNCNECFYGSKQ